jgi:hypothetical protein
MEPVLSSRLRRRSCDSNVGVFRKRCEKRNARDENRTLGWVHSERDLPGWARLSSYGLAL